MKANEAPEKLYMPFEDEIDRDCLNTYARRSFYHKEIEYTRTDAFIEKACKFIKDNGSHYIDIVNGQLVLKKGIINDFRKYIEGE